MDGKTLPLDGAFCASPPIALCEDEPMSPEDGQGRLLEISLENREVLASVRTTLEGLTVEFGRLREDVDSLKRDGIRAARLEQRVETLEAELGRLRQNQAWGIRIVIGAVILALLGLVLVKGSTVLGAALEVTR